MVKKFAKFLFFLFAWAALIGLSAAAETARQTARAPQSKDVKPDACYQCHDVIKALHAGGKHAMRG